MDIAPDPGYSYGMTNTKSSVSRTVLFSRYAQDVKPGMIVAVNDEQVAVETISAGYNTVSLNDGIREVRVAYGELLDVIGYFNP